MEFKLEQSVEVLAHTPAVLDALLRGKSAVWLDCRKSADAFSPADVVGHLILADTTDWPPRIRMILQGQGHSRSRPSTGSTSSASSRASP